MVDVTKPILSVNHLCVNGSETHLARQPFLKHGERHERLVKKSGVYFVKAQILHEVKGAVEVVLQDKGSQKSCVRACKDVRCGGTEHKVSERQVRRAWCVRHVHHCSGCGSPFGDAHSTLQPNLLEILCGPPSEHHQIPAFTATPV